jgi:GAF domain-containing protein
MQRPTHHPQEEERLKIIKSLEILDTHPEERFDRITKMAIEKFNMPISSITIIDKDREWFKSFKGLSHNESPRDESFCGHALLSKDIFEIVDTLEDQRFEGNPQVKRRQKPIRFYAGINLKHRESGLPVGVLCIKDYKPHKLSKEEIEIFKELAKEAEYEINKEKKLHSK